MASRIAPMPQQKQKTAREQPFKARSSETDSSLLRNGDQPQHQQQDYSPASVSTSFSEGQKVLTQKESASQSTVPPAHVAGGTDATTSSDRGDYTSLVKNRYFGGGGGAAAHSSNVHPSMYYHGTGRTNTIVNFEERSKSSSSNMSLSEVCDTADEGLPPTPTGGAAYASAAGSAGLNSPRCREDEDGDSWSDEGDSSDMYDNQTIENTRRGYTSPPLTLYSSAARKNSTDTPYATESAGAMSPLTSGMDFSSLRNTPNSKAASFGAGTPVPDPLLAASVTSSPSSCVLLGSINSSTTSSLKQPILYSAIGSLENFNTNSLTTLNNRYLAPSKEFCRPGGVTVHQSLLIPPVQHVTGHKTRKSNPESLSRTQILESHEHPNIANPSNQKPAQNGGGISSALCAVTTSGMSSRKSSSVSQKLNGGQVFGVFKKNAIDKHNDDESSNKEAEAQEQKLESSNRSHGTTSNIKANKVDKKNAKTNGKSTKKVTYGPVGDAKKKQVEMFRPSSDAYTPRIERRRIQYKAAEARTPVQHMASPMGTLQRPNFRDALRRVAMIIRQHVVKIEGRFEGQSDTKLANDDGLFKASMRDLFHEDTYRTPTYKCNMVRIPMARPGMVYGLRKINVMYEIPSETEIYDFAHQLFKSVQLSSECSIVCLIYIERLMEVAKVPLLASTWRPIFMCGLLLASKVWQDLSSWNIEFTGVYPQFSLEAINRLELNFLRNVKWDLFISSRYEQHVFLELDVLWSFLMPAFLTQFFLFI
jgi:hypothetical protein